MVRVQPEPPKKFFLSQLEWCLGSFPLVCLRKMVDWDLDAFLELHKARLSFLREKSAVLVLPGSLGLESRHPALKYRASREFLRAGYYITCRIFFSHRMSFCSPLFLTQGMLWLVKKSPARFRAGLLKVILAFIQQHSAASRPPPLDLRPGPRLRLRRLHRQVPRYQCRRASS